MVEMEEATKGNVVTMEATDLVKKMLNLLGAREVATLGAMTMANIAASA